MYAPEGPPVPHATLVPCLSNTERLETFGADDPAKLPAWPTDAQTAMFNLNVIAELQKHAEPHDLILLSAGRTHLPISEALPGRLYCEPGVGYEGIYLPYCAFESYAWMHTAYAKNGVNDGRFFDCVIPNYFDPVEFPNLNKGKGEYLAFLGRRIERKGLETAATLARFSDMPLLVAGAGTLKATSGDVKYMGPVNTEQRARFLAGAKALIVCTNYIEPFGGVAVEAMMCGTPVIATPWGAFTETVPPYAGALIHNLKEGVKAVKRVGELDPALIRAYAHKHYSLEAINPQFNRWFNQLHSLWGKGWYEL